MKPSLFRPVLLAAACLLACQAHGQNQIIREITPIPDPTTDPTGFFTRWMSAKAVTGTRAFIRTERTIDQTSFSSASFNSGRAYIILADGGVGAIEADTDDDGWSDETEIAYARSLSGGLYPEPTPIGTAYYLDPFYFPPINQYPMDVFNLFPNSPAFDLSTYYNPDYIAATPGDYSINGSARATRVSPFITDGKVRINAAPAGSLLSRPLALNVASKSIGYINSSTYSYDFLNFSLYYTARSYSSASQMETEMLPGDYQVNYRLLSNTTLEAGGFVNHRLVPNGTLAIGQKKPTWLIRKATKQLDSASSPVDYTWSGGFLQIDPRLPLNLTWDSLAGVAAISDKLDFKITDASGRVIWPSSVTQDISASLPVTSTQASFQIDPSYTNTAFGTPTSTLQPTGYLQLEYTRPLGASSSGDNSTVTLRVPVRFIRTYDSWKRYYFSGDNLTNASISGPSADPDGDLLTNQQEFEAGTSPVDGPKQLPIISSLTLTNLTFESVTISSNVTNVGRTPFIERGVLISETSSSPKVTDLPSVTTKVPVVGALGSFSADLSSLSTATIYFARAYATNVDGTAYSSVVAFYTPPGPPRVISPTLLIQRLADANYTATMGGTVVDDGGDDISTFRGIVYSLTSALPPGQELTRENGTAVFEIAGTSLASGRGSFTITVPGDPGTGIAYLQSGLEYVFRAYAVNASGVSYTDSTIFSMPVSVPVLNSPPTSSAVGSTTATLGGVATSNGGKPIGRRGVIYSLDPTKLTISQVNGTTVMDVFTDGPLASFPATFSQPVTGLTPTTTYYFRAYARNEVGYGYSQAASFTTLSNNADLSGLVLSSGTLTPVFVSGTIAYTASFSHATSSLTVTPTVAQANATVAVRIGANPFVNVASGTASAAQSMSVGTNTLEVRATAQDATTTKIYAVTLRRDPALSALSLSSGSLTPVFSAATTSYSANVTNATSTLRVTPTTTGATIQVRVNGGAYTAVTSGTQSGNLSLNVGSNTIDVLLTSTDTTTSATYTIAVNRAAPIPLPGETSVQWVPLPSSEPVAKMPLPGAQAALLPKVPMFVYEKHPDSMDDFIQYEVQISTNASDWQTAESAGWLVTGVDDPSSPEITATWTSTAPMPEKAFFRVKALPASADLEF